MRAVWSTATLTTSHFISSMGMATFRMSFSTYCARFVISNAKFGQQRQSSWNWRLVPPKRFSNTFRHTFIPFMTFLGVVVVEIIIVSGHGGCWWTRSSVKTAEFQILRSPCQTLHALKPKLPNYPASSIQLKLSKARSPVLYSAEVAN